MSQDEDVLCFHAVNDTTCSTPLLLVPVQLLLLRTVFLPRPTGQLYFPGFASEAAFLDLGWMQNLAGPEPRCRSPTAVFGAAVLLIRPDAVLRETSPYRDASATVLGWLQNFLWLEFISQVFRENSA